MTKVDNLSAILPAVTIENEPAEVALEHQGVGERVAIQRAHLQENAASLLEEEVLEGVDILTCGKRRCQTSNIMWLLYSQPNMQQ